MTDRDALLRAIAAAPGDDLPRLVYADWLDETGDPADAERAARIREKFPPPMVGRTRAVLGWQRYAADLLAGVVARSWQVWLIETPGSEPWERGPFGGEGWAAKCCGCSFFCSRPPVVVCLRYGFVVGVATGEREFFRVAGPLFRTQPVEWAMLLRTTPEFDRGRVALWGRRTTDREPARFWTLRPAVFDLLEGGSAGRPSWGESRDCRFYPDAKAAAAEALGAALVTFGRRAAAGQLTS